MNGERPLQNRGSSNCSNQLRINDELGGVYYTPPLDSPRSPIAVYPLSSTDDAPCRSLGLSSLLALNRKSILRLRQTATMISSESHVSVARWLTLFSVTRMGGSFSVAQIDRICSARDGARQSAGALDIHAQAGNGLVRAT